MFYYIGSSKPTRTTSYYIVTTGTLHPAALHPRAYTSCASSCVLSPCTADHVRLFSTATSSQKLVMDHFTSSQEYQAIDIIVVSWIALHLFHKCIVDTFHVFMSTGSPLHLLLSPYQQTTSFTKHSSWCLQSLSSASAFHAVIVDWIVVCLRACFLGLCCVSHLDSQCLYTQDLSILFTWVYCETVCTCVPCCVQTSHWQRLVFCSALSYTTKHCERYCMITVCCLVLDLDIVCV